MFSTIEFWDHLKILLSRLRRVDDIQSSVPYKIAGMLKREGMDGGNGELFLKTARAVVTTAIEKRAIFSAKKKLNKH
ncbi:hypothetical protein VSR82_25190 [Burkholderia sp. JPY481]